MLIAQETVKTTPRERTLRYLYRLLKAYERAQDAERVDGKNRLQAEANRLNAEQLELRKNEYRRRRELGLARRDGQGSEICQKGQEVGAA
jgi:hypothetical protein